MKESRSLLARESSGKGQFGALQPARQIRSDLRRPQGREPDVTIGMIGRIDRNCPFPVGPVRNFADSAGLAVDDFCDGHEKWTVVANEIVLERCLTRGKRMANCQNQIESELRLFTSGDGTGGGAMVEQRLPLLIELSDRFENVTGWKLSFEQRPRRRSTLDIGQPAAVSGRLAISDMSEKLPAGKSARHRGLCDQLVETLDGLIQNMLAEQNQLSQFESRLSDVVEIPFDWWQLAGRSGHDSHQMTTWSVTTEEKVRLFAAGMASHHKPDAAYCGAMLTGVFETLCQLPSRLDAIRTMMPAVLQSSPVSTTDLEWFATVELDPITGEYAIDGFHVDRGMCLVDVQTGSIVGLPDEDHRGVLYSGEILAMGVRPMRRKALSQSIFSAREMTVCSCRDILDREMSGRPALLLHRK